MKYVCASIWLVVLLSLPTRAQTLYRCNYGSVIFASEADLENISASSEQLKGVLEAETGRFAFSVSIVSFTGFNSPLQREHFNENYMESTEFTNALFEGKIIGDLDFVINGNYEIRAKGFMNIHGVKNEEIITCSIIVENQQIVVKANFQLLLSDYNITIPKVVSRKISEEIKVVINATLIK